ncbi:hypothetical protein JK636_07465 [Clostridium sp. YIM B02515]|uniref:Uncharacterized protein n=1 Tax=Clostridium rhizosphaerae TaxID=2803861 RepID=A0ABS1T8B3_9CLOT|nr:hypothetical protein [Clostridium rhizosphaerae]MBL4935595.1 hypothetical protein [Clostridium rhizosphaerae]
MYNCCFRADSDEVYEDDNVLTILDATIEKIFTNENTGYVLISYITTDPNFNVSKDFITLVVGPDTVILDPFGEKTSFNALRPGLRIYADFSAAMTYSIPPQARAFKIVISYKNMVFNGRMDRILEIDSENRFLYTGRAEDMLSQVRFVITDATQILDEEGKIIRLEDLRPGQLVRIAYATFMTASIPPQTTAFRVQLLREN